LLAPKMPNAVLLRLVVSSAIASSIVGGLYGYFVHDAWRTGVALGMVFGAAFPVLEVFGFQGRIGPDLRRLPFLVYIGLRSAAYVVVIIVIEALIVRLLNGPQPVTLGDIAFGLAVSVAGNLMFGMAELLGPGVLLAFVVGRYHRPRREERALLFIDLNASTATAERLGEARFLDFLSAFIANVSQAIVENRGEIHKYVGDEIIATWRLRPDRNDAGIVRACFAARDKLAARREDYERDFGVGADFRAALHGGPVIVGEIGTFKKEIALIGDAMNTTARILDACRDSGRNVLASATLLERLADFPAAIAVEPLAPLALRGKAAPLEVSALERRASDPSRSACL
jgi:adenylate cyclase